MSKPEEQSSSSGIICPYCEHENTDTTDIYDSDTEYEDECLKCEKLFTVTVEYSATYYSRPIKTETTD